MMWSAETTGARTSQGHPGTDVGIDPEGSALGVVSKPPSAEVSAWEMPIQAQPAGEAPRPWHTWITARQMRGVSIKLCFGVHVLPLPGPGSI